MIRPAPLIVLGIALSTPVLAQNAPAQNAPPPGALACSGCHPPAPVAGILVPALNGKPATEIVTQMAAFASGAQASTVMGRIAKGFNEDEVKAIAAWYAAQK
ncbi:cytochrome subunit of sulfide dehydrogenase [Variibacter gotjawalensis]|uniref:Cytochrome subunit of sulfide dehydrogenase n=1 Tax=Variibacter gotjawalensis TaxID=1333996 RepID=A0A0S3PYK3_9BRAD|nr:cytochrome C [Variibacter gotjawalensis]NIK46826.1 cytochrome c553 [Variibacter gotjawalensis]RZS48730.1 cytochrome c553 [Variibacter gotjawalensis]BAT60989.1 cytochrome subunit of sulfide dehydrogenase [Variibacter gotjawalensis]